MRRRAAPPSTRNRGSPSQDEWHEPRDGQPTTQTCGRREGRGRAPEGRADAGAQRRQASRTQAPDGGSTPATSLPRPTAQPFRLLRVRSTLREVAPDLVGLSEVAEMLGVSRQRASQLVRDYDDFPAPAASLASGRVWERPKVETWMRAHPVRRPGRPPHRDANPESAQ